MSDQSDRGQLGKPNVLRGIGGEDAPTSGSSLALSAFNEWFESELKPKFAGLVDRMGRYEKGIKNLGAYTSTALALATLIVTVNGGFSAATAIAISMFVAGAAMFTSAVVLAPLTGDDANSPFRFGVLVTVSGILMLSGIFLAFSSQGQYEYDLADLEDRVNKLEESAISTNDE